MWSQTNSYFAGNNGNVSGQVVTRGTSTWTQTFAYDSMNRLTNASEVNQSAAATWAEVHGFDRYGNHWLTSRSGAGMTINNALTPQVASAIDLATNRLKLSSNWTADFDARGNQKFYDMNRTMVYDGENRLTAVNGASGAAASAANEYDGNGRRVRKLVCGSATPCTAGTSGVKITTYVYDAAGSLAAEYSNVTATENDIRYLTADHLGSTRLITKQNGTADKCYDYLPFGEEIPSAAGGRGAAAGCYGSTASKNTVEFTSKERDAETGLDFFGARYFSSAQGRFTSPDKPFADQNPADPQSWNLYGYVRNNPLAHVDSDGRACVSLNYGSPFCDRATLYGQLDARVGKQTRFFAAASAASQLLAGADISLPFNEGGVDHPFPVGRMLVSDSTRDFLNDVGVMLRSENVKLAGAIANGSLAGPGLDYKMVHAEQTFVQQSLDKLKASDPKAYANVITENNNALNATGLRAFAQTRYGTDAAFAKVLGGVRKSLGGKIDFGNQKHREAMGRALVDHIRGTGGCDVTGDRVNGCK